MFRTKFVGNLKAHISCSIFFLENCAFCELMWKYMVHPEGPGMTNKIRQHELCMPDN